MLGFHIVGFFSFCSLAWQAWRTHEFTVKIRPVSALAVLLARAESMKRGNQ